MKKYSTKTSTTVAEDLFPKEEMSIERAIEVFNREIYRGRFLDEKGYELHPISQRELAEYTEANDIIHSKNIYSSYEAYADIKAKYTKEYFMNYFTHLGY